MLSLDDTEVAATLLAVRIAIQKTLGAAAAAEKYGPADYCCQYCAAEFAAVRNRLEQYLKDVAEEKADG
jgi:hypothetical protein